MHNLGPNTYNWCLRLGGSHGTEPFICGVRANTGQLESELSEAVGHPVSVPQELDNLLVWKSLHIWCQKCEEYRNRGIPLTMVNSINTAYNFPVLPALKLCEY